MRDITVLYQPARITLLFSLYPLISGAYRKRFLFTQDHEFCLNRDTNKKLIIVRFLKGDNYSGSSVELLKKLRQKYDKIIFFDDSDGAGSTHFHYMPHIDYYYKKQLLRDQKNYFRELYGKQVFSDYYHRRYGVTDNKETIRQPLENETHLKKLKLAWNLGVGSYDSLLWSERLARKALINLSNLGILRYIYKKPQAKQLVDKPKISKIQARFEGGKFQQSISYQRRLFLRKARGLPSVFSTGSVSVKTYNRELTQITGVLSPFGWGEICFRDFEAIKNRAVLIKPDMDHLITWPDLYQKTKPTCRLIGRERI